MGGSEIGLKTGSKLKSNPSASQGSSSCQTSEIARLSKNADLLEIHPTVSKEGREMAAIGASQPHSGNMASWLQADRRSRQNRNSYYI